ncbi:hypothetical protein FOPG_18408 [Fusarium oxysporum f. sp. conglutinans race 2 54008]|uniref:Myb-like domain-containing protein n=3 Tax=Fusarium oxysporum f. sp. conglutinans TaxID=100902 RepID=A0A8H6GKV3_FUSOX|nr:hypothetical protein FOXB_06737 [Fusarium oxysporum f. sp. conglutinans Fo5176]EXL65357.1 hypothetical protein FOPG_18408 [Fusarium oxysporum f. sp. conglutinans race 2 54008]KAF6519502.1 hypothetical protein HZS61_017876 [Fusarium oxysporum f. sp. conglutinans]KAG6986236.1 hypothetical protein FocnCong_v003750 [Fusarium oxysporum f. sp. conglutinans]KAI8405711.1 hypothetical protein FOFC_15199 [Fusarium oxysporum]
MALVFKSYDPVQHQQRAKRRQQKRSARRSTLAPISATCVGSPPSQSLVAGHKCSWVDEKFVPSTNTDRTKDPYSDFPSPEECLEFCSRKDITVSSAYTSTSGNLPSYPDSAIEIQDASSDSSYQDDGYKDDELRQKLLAAIATTRLTSKLNIELEAYNVNTSRSPAPTTVSEEESDTEISPAEHAWSSDAETTPSTASSISTLSATSPACQKETWKNQDASVDSEEGAQDTCTRIANLDVPDAMSNAALSGVNLPALESQDNIALEPSSSDANNRPHSQDGQASRVLASAASTTESFTEPSVTELSSTKRTPDHDAASLSTKRSFSESGATNNSQPSSSDICHSSKRLRLTSTSSEEAVSTLLDIQKMISNVLAKLCQGQPPSLIPDVSVQSMADTIEVAGDEMGNNSSDDSSTCSSFDDSESEIEVTTSQPRCSQQRSTRRRRWTSTEEKLLRRLKSTQRRNKGTPSDCEIASRLGRSGNGVKQHWDIMLQKNRGRR